MEDFETEVKRRLDTIEQNIGALGVSVNSVVESVNGFMQNAMSFMNSGGLGKVMGMLGGRVDG
jgi:hypothetical protein